MPVTLPGEGFPAPLPPTPRPERRHHRRRGLIIGGSAVALAATIGIAAATGRHGGTPTQETSQPQKGNAECVKVVDDRAAILATLATAKAANKPWDFNTAQAAATRYNLVVVDGRRIAETESNDDDAGAVVAQVDDFTGKNFNGLRIGNVTTDANTKDDALEVLTIFGDLPTAMGNATTVAKVDLSAASSASAVTILQRNSAVVSGYNPGQNNAPATAWVASGHVQDGFAAVTFGLGGEAVACKVPGKDPEFASISGTADVQGEYARAASALFSPTAEDCRDVTGDARLANEMALIAERAATLTGSEGMDRYLAERFVGRCTLELAHG